MFKRSQKVNSYRGKWAACSGHIESSDPNPLAAAWRELQEETTLTADDLTFLRGGKPFKVVDDELNTEWTIHPFAFLLKSNAKATVIDWEHTEWRFVRPEEVKTYDTVPHLLTTLSHILVGDDTAAGLQALQDDHQNGGRVLATKGVETLLQAVQGRDLAKASDVGSFWEGLRLAGWHIAKNGRPSMGAAISYAVLSALHSIKEACPPNNGVDLSEFKQKATKSLQNAINERKKSADRMTQSFQAYIEDQFGDKPVTILTLSSSSTVRRCLTAALVEKPNRHINLKILESRPLFEGVTFASSFLDDLQGLGKGVVERLNVEIGSDASGGLIAKDADIVLIGADRISENGDVSNKTGSLSATLLAKEVTKKVKLVVISELEKIAGPGEISEHKEENNDISELTAAWPLDEQTKGDLIKSNRVQIKNVYFEWVPAKYVDSYICETGILEREDIKSQSHRVAAMEEEIFGDL